MAVTSPKRKIDMEAQAEFIAVRLSLLFFQRVEPSLYTFINARF